MELSYRAGFSVTLCQLFNPMQEFFCLRLMRILILLGRGRIRRTTAIWHILQERLINVSVLSFALTCLVAFSERLLEGRLFLYLGYLSSE